MTRCQACGISPALTGPANLSHLCRVCRSTNPNLPHQSPSSFVRARPPSVHRDDDIDTQSPSPQKRRRTTTTPSLTPSSPSSSSSSSSCCSPFSYLPSTILSPTNKQSSHHSQARTVSTGTELLRLRKKRLTQPPLTCRKPPEDHSDSNTNTNNDSPPHPQITISKNRTNHPLTSKPLSDDSNHHHGFARLTPNPPNGRHWPGRDTVLAVRRALFRAADPVEQLSDHIFVTDGGTTDIRPSPNRDDPSETPAMDTESSVSILAAKDSLHCDESPPPSPSRQKTEKPPGQPSSNTHMLPTAAANRIQTTIELNQYNSLPRPSADAPLSRRRLAQDLFLPSPRLNCDETSHLNANVTVSDRNGLIPASKHVRQDDSTMRKVSLRPSIPKKRLEISDGSRPRPEVSHSRSLLLQPQKPPLSGDARQDLRHNAPTRLPRPPSTEIEPGADSTMRKSAIIKALFPERGSFFWPRGITPDTRDPRSQSYKRSAQRKLQTSDVTRPLYRALPLTAWPQPRINPRLSSYTFGSDVGSKRLAQPERAIHSMVPVHASASADRDPVTMRPRQGVTRGHESRQFRVPNSSPSALPIHFRPPSSEKRIKPPLFSRKVPENRRVKANEPGLVPSSGRNAAFLRSVSQERRMEKRLLFSPPTNRGSRIISHPLEKVPKEPRNTVDRQKELRRRLVELRRLKAKRIAEAKAKPRTERAVRERREREGTRPQPNLFRSVPVRHGSAEERQSLDHIDIARPSSPVTSSGERMRHAVVETRQDWRRVRKALGTLRQTAQETHISPRGDPHPPFSDVCHPLRATPIARPRTVLPKKITEDAEKDHIQCRAAAEECVEGTNENTNLIVASGSTPVAKTHQIEGNIRQPREEESQNHLMADEVTDRSRNNDQRDAEDNEGVRESLSHAKSSRFIKPKPLSKNIDEVPLNSPCRVNSLARFLFSQKAPVANRQDVVADPDPAAPTLNRAIQEGGFSVEPVTQEDVESRDTQETFTIKVACRYGWAKSTRRLAIGRNVTFPELKNQLKVGFEMTKPFAITYRDEEGDFVKVSSDAEMTHMLDMAGRDTTPMQVKLIPPHGQLVEND